MNVILWLFVLEIQEKGDMFPQILKLYSFVVFIISSLPQSVLMVLVVVFLMCVFWLL